MNLKLKLAGKTLAAAGIVCNIIGFGIGLLGNKITDMQLDELVTEKVAEAIKDLK